MAKNLCYQMTSAIENGFKPGMDKHSIKAQCKNSDYRIFSFASRKEMIDFSYRFSAFMKSTFPEIRQVKDITIEHINAYLVNKTNVTQMTIQHEVACINKLELCVNKKFSIKVDWRKGREIPIVQKVKIRNQAFSPEQIKGLDDYFSTKRDSYSKRAYFLAKRFSLRASEVVKIQIRDIRWDKNILHIHDSKGKRCRDLIMTEEDKKFLKEIVKGKSEKERLIPLKSDSICAFLNRACRVLGYQNIVESKSSYHALRKYSISQYYKEQCKVYGEEKARGRVMERLGHSRNRDDLYKIYIIT